MEGQPHPGPLLTAGVPDPCLTVQGGLGFDCPTKDLSEFQRLFFTLPSGLSPDVWEAELGCWGEEGTADPQVAQTGFSFNLDFFIHLGTNRMVADFMCFCLFCHIA